MKNIVISGSSKLLEKVIYWKNYFENKNFNVLDFPKKVDNKDLTIVYKNFYNAIENADVFFLMNEDKHIPGYIGYGSYAELSYAIMLKLLHNKNIDIYILKVPSESVSCYDEIKFWLDQELIKIYEDDLYE